MMDTAFYTQNGLRYEIGKGAKEVAKELREYIKTQADLKGCKWSITSKWGMQADELNISLMAAPFEVFSNEYKNTHEYDYKRGYNEHGTVKEWLTPKAFTIIQKVKTFVLQYIHDDTDIMTDFFDRNIYDFYEIGKFDKPFKLIEPVKEVQEIKETENGRYKIVEYSAKALAVYGDTKAIKETLKELGGRFNPRLRDGAGWIFSKRKESELKALLNIA